MIQGGRSGVGRYVIALAEALVVQGIDMHIAGMDADRGHFPFIDDGNWVTIPEWAGAGFKNLLWHQLFLPGVVKRGGYDVVHIPSYRRMLICCSKPQVATIHDCAPFIMAQKYDFLRGLFGRRIVPWIARRMDRIIAVSQTTADDIARFLGVELRKLRVIPNGIDHERFQVEYVNTLSVFRERVGLNRPYLIYIARFEHPAKNHVRLIEAFTKFREETSLDWELVLGGAPWHGSEIIDEAINASPAQSAIRRAGFIDDADLPLWYAASEALVFPSLMEGFGFPVIEAQACGTLVVTSDCTSLGEVKGPASLVFDPMDVASMKDALIDLSQLTAQERNKRIIQGRAWAEQFNWEVVARSCIDVYEEVLRG